VLLNPKDIKTNNFEKNNLLALKILDIQDGTKEEK
jgi:hypothetical protein